jgi:hypothetical protein
MTMKKKLLCLAAILVVLPLILTAPSCKRVTAITLQVHNDTGACSSGPCVLNVRYKHQSGGGSEKPFGPNSLNLTVNPGFSPQVEYVQGLSNFTTQSACHNLEGTVDFPPGSWIHRFFCGTNADGEKVLQHELVAAD